MASVGDVRLARIATETFRVGPVFLLFEVKDTGQGLSDEEKKSLFQRFVQASSRTHVKYGGSGLGLFISRRLTELQNGAIGVASQPGVGSTFAFYIEAYVPSPAALRDAENSASAAKSATIHDRDFRRGELDVGVIDAQASHGREQMLPCLLWYRR